LLLMFGDWVNNGTPVPVKTERILADGNTRVYLAEDDGFTKMVTDKNEAKYYKGNISEFDSNNWGSYTIATGHYHVKHVAFVPYSLIMYGDWVANGKDVTVISALVLADGKTWVYLIEDDNKTKMVTDSGEARYYEGQASQFDPQKWSTYTVATGHYHVKSSGMMFGDWVNNGTPVPVKTERILEDGLTRVYLTEDDGFTKMVTDKSEAKYYKGHILEFDNINWASYTVATGHYHLSFGFKPSSLVMFGDWIGSDVPVASEIALVDNTDVFLIEHDSFTKMVSEKGEAKYYKGVIAQFHACNWGTYTVATGHYHVKSSLVMYGDWVNNGTPVPVVTERILVDDKTRVYLIEDDSKTKMVTEKGEARYYQGHISEFNNEKWGTYQDAAGHYHVRNA